MRQVYNVESPPSSMLFDTSGIEAGDRDVTETLATFSSPISGLQCVQQPQLEQLAQPAQAQTERQASPSRLTLANLIPSRFAFHFEVSFVCTVAACPVDSTLLLPIFFLWLIRLNPYMVSLFIYSLLCHS